MAQTQKRSKSTDPQNQRQNLPLSTPPPSRAQSYSDDLALTQDGFRKLGWGKRAKKRVQEKLHRKSTTANRAKSNVDRTAHTLESSLKSIERESGVESDFDDLQITLMYERYVDNIRNWCLTYINVDPERFLDVSPSKCTFLKSLKSEDIRDPRLLFRSSGQYFAQAFICDIVEQKILGLGENGPQTPDIWAAESLSLALDMVEKAMRTSGMENSHVNLWRSVTVKALDKTHTDETLDGRNMQALLTEIRQWMQPIFEDQNSGNYTQSSTSLAQSIVVYKGKNDTYYDPFESLKTDVLFYAAWLLLQIRKKASEIKTKSDFASNGIITFSSAMMEDLEERASKELCEGMKVLMVVTPALIRVTDIKGVKLNTPRVLKKAQVLLDFRTAVG